MCVIYQCWYAYQIVELRIIGGCWKINKKWLIQYKNFKWNLKDDYMEN